jgi:hypothetical protein
VRAALHWLFTRTDAVDVATKCPTGRHQGARHPHRRPEAVHPAAGLDPRGQAVPADVYGLSVQDWALSAPGLAERGHWFHEKLEREYARLGAHDPAPHPDDELHDRFAGMACDMIMGGQPQKAAVFYNRWAASPATRPITISTPSRRSPSTSLTPS